MPLLPPRRHPAKSPYTEWLIRALSLLSILPLLLTALPACSRATPPPSVSSVLEAMHAADTTLPAGLLYDRAAPTEAPNHLGDTLLSALYGSAVNALILPKITATTTVAPPRETGALPQVEIAVFLAQALHPGEIAVFRCPDARTVAAAAALCRTRLDTIRRGWSDSDYASLTERGTVVVEGSYVLLVVAEDPERILTAARRAIKG